MKCRYVEFERLSEVFREHRDDVKPYVEFRDIKEVESFLYECLNEEEDIHFFSLYGQLAVTTYPRELKEIMIDIITEFRRFANAS